MEVIIYVQVAAVAELEQLVLMLEVALILQELEVMVYQLIHLGVQ